MRNVTDGEMGSSATHAWSWSSDSVDGNRGQRVDVKIERLSKRRRHDTDGAAAVDEGFRVSPVYRDIDPSEVVHARGSPWEFFGSTGGDRLCASLSLNFEGGYEHF